MISHPGQLAVVKRLARALLKAVFPDGRVDGVLQRRLVPLHALSRVHRVARPVSQPRHFLVVLCIVALAELPVHLVEVLLDLDPLELLLDVIDLEKAEQTGRHPNDKDGYALVLYLLDECNEGVECRRVNNLKLPMKGFGVELGSSHVHNLQLNVEGFFGAEELGAHLKSKTMDEMPVFSTACLNWSEMMFLSADAAENVKSPSTRHTRMSLSLMFVGSISASVSERPKPAAPGK